MEAIDIINIKCHDLKHQLRALERVEDEETFPKWQEDIPFKNEVKLSLDLLQGKRAKRTLAVNSKL